MNNVREVNRINEKELELAVEGGASWHDDYKDSAYIFMGNLDKRLTEGDVISVFSQYGEVLDINLPRIPEGGLRDQNGENNQGRNANEQPRQQQQQQTGKPGDRRGFGFLLYEDQRSTVLAVDNLNGFSLLGRTIRVDHVKDYKMPGAKKREEEGELIEPSRNAAPALLEGSASEDDEQEEQDGLDLADPMASFIAASRKDKSRSKEEKEERRKRKLERQLKREERDAKKRGHVDGDRDSSAKRRRSEEKEPQRRGNRETRVDREHSRDHERSSKYREDSYRDRSYHRDEDRRDYREKEADHKRSHRYESRDYDQPRWSDRQHYRER